MENVHDPSPKRNTHFSPSFLRTLLLMLELLEQEWRRPHAKASRRWRSSNPAQDALFRQAHRALAGLWNLQENGVITP
jgi:hypothetical protein